MDLEKEERERGELNIVIPVKTGIQEKRLRALSFQRKIENTHCFFVAFLELNIQSVYTWIPNQVGNDNSITQYPIPNTQYLT